MSNQRTDPPILILSANVIGPEAVKDVTPETAPATVKSPPMVILSVDLNVVTVCIAPAMSRFVTPLKRPPICILSVDLNVVAV